MITHKIGDSIKWKIKSTQSNGVPVDWSTTNIEARVINKFTGVVLFSVSTLTNDDNSYITKANLSNGEFDVVVKDTESFKKGGISTRL